jgi:hypothetical protein
LTLLASILVTAVVWTVSMMPSVRLRAFVYSLPLPITLVLAATDVRVDGSLFLGVALLVAFFGLVALFHEGFGWPILLADLGGLAGYVGISALIGLLPPLPIVPALAAVSALWALTVAVLRPWRAADTPVRPARRTPAIGKLVVVFAAALLTTQLGALLRGLVVTFPYSGVLVVIETRHQLAAFTRQFAMNSIGLVTFLGGFALLQDLDRAVAMAAAWAAFGVTAALVTLVSHRLSRRHHQTIQISASQAPERRQDHPDGSAADA